MQAPYSKSIPGRSKGTCVYCKELVVRVLELRKLNMLAKD